MLQRNIERKKMKIELYKKIANDNNKWSQSQGKKSIKLRNNNNGHKAKKKNKRVAFIIAINILCRSLTDPIPHDFSTYMSTNW